MFGMSFTELVVIGVLAMVLLGPDRLPEAAKTIGKTIRDLKKATDGLKDQVQRELLDVQSSVEKAINAPEIPPVASAAMAATIRPVAEVIQAARDNIPGLDAALFEPSPAPVPPAAPPAVSPPAPAPGGAGPTPST
jgi:sec-independent protein translocase protein TatB